MSCYQSVDKARLYAWLPESSEEPNLAKVGVEGSNPFARSNTCPSFQGYLQKAVGLVRRLFCFGDTSGFGGKDNG